MRVNQLAAIAVLAAGLCGTAMAQNAAPTSPQGGPGAARGMRGDFHGVGGQITAIQGSTITLQNRNGEVARVKITSSTRIMKDGVEAKLSEFKVGDRVFAAGEQGKDGVWIAQMLGQRAGGGMGGMQAKPEDNGKTYIFGEVTKIDGTKLTIRKPDNTEQMIEVDDETSFRNERRESMTLADVKVGDFVHGQGAVKSGIFVPTSLNAGRPRGAHQGAPPPLPPGGAPQNQNQTVPDSNDQVK